MLPRLLAIYFLLSAGVTTASGCPWCESQIARKVRQEIFSVTFWENAVLVILPLLALLVLVALIHYWPTSGKAPRHVHDQ